MPFSRHSELTSLGEYSIGRSYGLLNIAASMGLTELLVGEAEIVVDTFVCDPNRHEIG